jgi:LuxR family maltose regulon positive regulatory protein
MLLPTKLRPPRLRGNRISRRRLLGRLDDAQTKVAIVLAPAGFGKTTLLAQWVSEQDDPIAWLTLGPEDNALPTFVAYLIAAFTSVDRELVEDALRRATASGPPSSETTLLALLNELATYSVPWGFVIDDYHVVDNPEIDHVVRQLIEHTPDDCRIVIASRTEPALPLARLHVRQELTLLGVDDLRVTTAELPELLAAYGIAASATEQLALNEHTDGWIAALHLSAIASTASSLEHVLASLSSFDGNLTTLGSFLLDEVLDQQPPELRAFLLQTAILDRFTVETCYAVTQRQNAGELLEQIQRRNLFLVLLDREGVWFRYHHLFGDFLRRRCALEADPVTIPALHAAASQWFEQQHLIGEAITHATRAGDWARAARMIAMVAPALIEQQGERDLLAWLRTFPDTVVHADPDLSSMAAYALVRHGRATEAAPLLDVAEQHWRAAGNHNGLSVIGLIRGAIARFRDDPEEIVTHAAAAIAHATGEQVLDADGRLADVTPRFLRYEGTWAGNTEVMTSFGHLAAGLRLKGRIPDAATVYQRIESAHAAAGWEITSTYFAPEYAALRIAQGQLYLAESLCRATLNHGPQLLASERMYAHASLGEVLREWNRLDEAQAAVREGLALAEQFDTPIMLPLLYGTLARALWSAGDDAGALAALDAMADAAVGLQNLRRGWDAQALRVRIALAAGDLVPATRWVVERSLRVAHMPESATFAEQLVYARVLLAQDEAGQAARVLTRLRDGAEHDGRVHDLIQVCVLLSLAYLDLFELDQAIAVLQHALELGAPHDYRRVFLDEGAPMTRLLRMAHRRGVQVRHVQSLLAAAGAEPGEVVRMQHRELVEPITARELEVLQLAAVGLSNREISDELVISVATTKRHVSNIYGKLGVSSRAEAVHKARRLGLLATELMSSRRGGAEP